jgi:hypothetical protein
MTQNQSEAKILMDLWRGAVQGECPEDRQFTLWLSMHPLARIVGAISETARKQKKRSGTMTDEYLVRFCSRAANDLKSREEAKVAA